MAWLKPVPTKILTPFISLSRIKSPLAAGVPQYFPYGSWIEPAGTLLALNLDANSTPSNSCFIDKKESISLTGRAIYDPNFIALVNWSLSQLWLTQNGCQGLKLLYHCQRLDNALAVFC